MNRTFVLTLVTIFAIALIGLAVASVLKLQKGKVNTPAPIQTADQGNALEKKDKIVLDTPKPGSAVTSPLALTGKARGTWYFEASFPVELRDNKGALVAQGHATAVGDWMTEEFVPFTAILTFVKPSSGTGTLVLKKDNPSGDPVRDEDLHIPISF